jgi:tRNA(fMet)-specific endonuclease VapC
LTVRFLLDTNVVSAPIARKPDRKVVSRLVQYGVHCAIAAPVWHELTFGCERLPSGDRRTAVEDYLRTVVKVSFPILPYDEAAATWHGQERARLEKIGKTAPFVDGQIAAIARQNNLTIVTGNPKHFALFDGLTVADWSA